MQKQVISPSSRHAPGETAGTTARHAETFVCVCVFVCVGVYLDFPQNIAVTQLLDPATSVGNASHDEPTQKSYSKPYYYSNTHKHATNPKPKTKPKPKA